MKIYAHRKAGGKEKTGFASNFFPPHGPLRFLTSHSRVTRVSLAFRARLCAKNEALEEEADMIQPLKEPFQCNFGQNCSVPNYLSQATPGTMILK